MAFMHRDHNKSPSPTKNNDPQRCTITQFKFTPQASSTPVLGKLRFNPSPDPPSSPIITHQIPRRGLSFRTDREKKLERLSSCKKIFHLDQMPIETKPHTFMNWRERNTPPKKMFLPAETILLDMMRTTQRDFPDRIRSEKKIVAVNFDLDPRRNKVQTAARVKGNSPMELLTRKLQWRGREIKRAQPYSSETKKANRDKETSKGDPRIEKIFLANLNGWEPEISGQFLPGEHI